MVTHFLVRRNTKEYKKIFVLEKTNTENNFNLPRRQCIEVVLLFFSPLYMFCTIKTEGNFGYHINHL